MTVVGSVKKHVECANCEQFVLVLTQKGLLFRSDQGSLVNRAVEAGPTNHLFGHPTSDHDSFFRRPD